MPGNKALPQNVLACGVTREVQTHGSLYSEGGVPAHFSALAPGSTWYAPHTQPELGITTDTLGGQGHSPLGVLFWNNFPVGLLELL